MHSAFPVFATTEECSESCTSMVSLCVEEGGNFVCQLNVSIFILVILLAVFTGIVLPVALIYCYLTRCCRRSIFNDRANCIERQRLNPKSIQVSLSVSDETNLIARRDPRTTFGRKNPTPGRAVLQA